MRNLGVVLACLCIAIVSMGIIIFAFASANPQNYQDSHINESQAQVTQDYNKEDVLEKINSATTVEVREKIISFNKAYIIYIDGSQVATVSGKYVNVTGDVFTLKDNNGNTLMTEKQIKRWGIKLNRAAKISDAKGNTVGYFGEDVISDFFSLDSYRFHIYDENKKEYAYTDEKLLSLLYDLEIKNNSHEVIYKIKENLDLLTDEYTITKVKDSNVTMDRAIFLTCIIDAIMDANNN